MIELKKDEKSETWIVTKTDNEGFHHQLNLTRDEMAELDVELRIALDVD